MSIQYESKTPQNTSPKVLKTCMGLNHFGAIGFSVIHFENYARNQNKCIFLIFFLQTNLSSKSSISDNHYAHQRTLAWFYSLTKNSLEKVLPAFASEVIWLKDYLTFLSCKSLLVEQCDQLILVNVETEKNMGSLITRHKTKTIQIPMLCP